MTYVITGASGFIGKRLVRALLARPDAQRLSISCATRRRSGLRRCDAFWGADERARRSAGRPAACPICGLAAGDDQRDLRGRVDHFFHLARGL